MKVKYIYSLIAIDDSKLNGVNSKGVDKFIEWMKSEKAKVRGDILLINLGG